VGNERVIGRNSFLFFARFLPCRSVAWFPPRNHFLMSNFVLRVLLQWMFGVMLWELTTLAQQPYLEVDPFEMAAYLRDGYRLAQPLNCPDEL
jgi:Protein tyrosine and serine/threonine kinase